MSTCSAAFRYTLDRLGPHGLPLIGRADWNDCLNLNCFSDTPGQSFQTTTNKDGKDGGVGLHRGAVRPGGTELAEIAQNGRSERRKPSSYLAAAAKMEATVCSSTAGTGSGSSAPTTTLGATDRLGRVRGGQDLHRAAGHLHHGRHRPGDGDAAEGAGLGEGTPGHAARHRAPAAGLFPVLPPPGRDLLLSAGLQGERRDLLPQQSLDHDRRDHGWDTATRRSTIISASIRRRARRSASCIAASPTSTRR